tara:strand:- start:3126 stop:3560 length:435 start_codon:yes stop_codon:yes gene_type:complete
MARKTRDELEVSKIIREVRYLSEQDVLSLIDSERSYGDSWRNRGGIGAFMMLARKWDRIENQTRKYGYDVFKTISEDASKEGILDDIADLRRYLFLVEAHIRICPDTRLESQLTKEGVIGGNAVGGNAEGNRLAAEESNYSEES